jgi:protein-tyrosine phosphatase
MNILFVCTGNICRSPLAEGILRKKYTERNLTGRIDSCGFESFHLGEPPDPRTQKVARTNGIDVSSHRVRMFSVDDFDRFDRIYVMDSYHYQSVLRLARHAEDRRKVDFVMNVVSPGENKAVKDPYFSDYSAFEKAFDQLDAACELIVRNHPQGEKP